MLTKKQHQLLIFIQERIAQTGVSPSFDEMKEALELRSKSGIHRLITALEERGFIRRLPHRARALEILRMPDDTAPPPKAPAQAPALAANENASAPAMAESNSFMELPVLGKIAAGTPIDAIQHEVSRIAAPAALIGRGEHFILEVEGESMIDAGIHDGDYAIVQRCEDAPTGEIVVALVDREEATLKRLRKKSGEVILEAENPDFPDRRFGPDRVSVQGKLVGLMRKY